MQNAFCERNSPAKSTIVRKFRKYSALTETRAILALADEEHQHLQKTLMLSGLQENSPSRKILGEGGGGGGEPHFALREMADTLKGKELR